MIVHGTIRTCCTFKALPELLVSVVADWSAELSVDSSAEVGARPKNWFASALITLFVAVAGGLVN